MADGVGVPGPLGSDAAAPVRSAWRWLAAVGTEVAAPLFIFRTIGVTIPAEHFAAPHQIVAVASANRITRGGYLWLVLLVHRNPPG